MLGSLIYDYLILPITRFRSNLKTKRAPHAEAKAHLLSLNALKGHNFVQKPYRVMPLGQIAALVMVNVH